MWNRIKAEPALLMAIFKAALVLALAFGLKLTPEQRDAMMGLAAVIVGLGGVTRAMVTPNAKQNEPPPPSNINALLVLLCALVFGCSSVPPAMAPGRCHGVPRAELTALFLANVTALKASGRCSSYPDQTQCPEYLALKQRQRERAERWVECP